MSMRLDALVQGSPTRGYTEDPTRVWVWLWWVALRVVLAAVVCPPRGVAGQGVVALPMWAW